MPRLLDPSAYGPIIAELLAEERLSPLGPGSPNRAMQSKLERFRPEEAFAPHSIRDQEMAAACHSALWLYHDFLDRSHTISQDLATTTGSYWHGIMHRREPDASNAAYWFRRVGEHPVFESLAKAATDLGYPTRGARWDPFAFIDACEAHRGKGHATETLLQQVQQAEWELLFDWCYRQAIEG